LYRKFGLSCNTGASVLEWIQKYFMAWKNCNAYDTGRGERRVMNNVIAVIWDFDKTLIDGYMQDPFFEEYGINSKEFWKEVGALPDKYKAKGVEVNKDTVYLNYLIHYARKHELYDLNNEKLKGYGKKLKFYPGAIELIRYLNEDILKEHANLDKEHPKQYGEYGIKVENYVVSTGIKKIIEGSELAPLLEHYWGCELIDSDMIDENAEHSMIADVGYTIDNTTKTRALFEINKGIPQQPELDVNAKVPEEMRRVKFQNMIYIADGPSDVPAFSLINKYGGATFAIYPHGSQEAFHQVEKLREDGRINMFAEADYREGTTAYMWITGKVLEIANRICEEERAKLESAVSNGPEHLT
jgi:hypothetical protein